MTQANTTKTSIDIFNEAVAYFGSLTKSEILAEGQALDCKFITHYSLKKTIAWHVALRYMFINEKPAYTDLMANYDINTHDCIATPKVGYVPNTIDASDWVGELNAENQYGLSAQHVAYIADDLVKMKQIICYHDTEASRNEIDNYEARAITAENLITNGVGQAITRPHNDYHYWLEELQSYVPLITINAVDASKKLSQYRRHGGTVSDKNGSLTKQEMLVVILQEINGITGYLESFGSDRQVSLPKYAKQDSIPPLLAFTHNDFLIQSPVNTKISTNEVLVLHSRYQCKLSVKSAVLSTLKMHPSGVDQVIVPMVVKNQESGVYALIWNSSVFDIEIVGGKIDVVSEIFASKNTVMNWHKKAFLMRQLLTTDESSIKSCVPVDASYSQKYSIPGVLRVSEKDNCFIRCEQFPELRSSRSVEISQDGGDTWHCAFTLLGYEIRHQRGKEVQYYTLQYEPRK